MAKPYSLSKHKFLDDKEYDLLVKLLESHSSVAGNVFRDVTLLYLLLYTGARISEALLTTAKDLDHNSYTIFLTGLKESDDREIPLPGWLFMRLAHLSKDVQPDDPIFPIAKRTLQHIWHQWRPGGCDKGIHSLRHTFALRLYQRTKDIQLVQTALGHRSIQNTMIYAKYTYKQKEFRRLICG